MAQLLAVFNTSWQLKTLSVHSLTTSRVWSQDDADSKQVLFRSHKNCVSNQCTVFQPYFFWTSSGSSIWHNTGPSLQVCLWQYKECATKMCSPRPKTLHGTSETDSEYKYSKKLDFLNPWADTAPEPAFFPHKPQISHFLKISGSLFQGFCCCQKCDVSVLFSGTGHWPGPKQHPSLWHTTPVQEMVPENFILRNPGGFQQLSQYKRRLLPREENSPMHTQSQGADPHLRQQFPTLQSTEPRSGCKLDQALAVLVSSASSKGTGMKVHKFVEEMAV